MLTFETDVMTRDELADHDAVVRALRAAHRNVATHSGRRADRTWLVAKDEMNWSGPKGIRPSFRLAGMVLAELTDEALRAASRAIGRYDVAIAPEGTRAD